MKGSAKPFEFSNLPKLSRARLALDRVFHSTMSFNIVSINGVLNDVLGELGLLSTEKLKLALDSCILETKDRAIAHFGKDSLCVGGVFHERNIPFAILINERSVVELVYLLMGSKADISSNKAFLTPVEEGIFSFILSRFFHSLHGHLAESLQINAHLDPFERTKTPQEIFLEESQVLNFFLELKIDGVASRFSLLVAAREFLSLFSASSVQEQSDIRELGLQRASDFNASVSFVAGQLALELNQLESLQVGDVVILDSTGLHIKDESLSGEITCCFGYPLFAIANGQINLSENGKYNIQLYNLAATTPKDMENA